MTYSRRGFFVGLARQMADQISRTVSAVVTTPSPSPASSPKADVSLFLRPPGAIEGEFFLVACTRCTDCIEACPYQSIRRLGPQFGDDAGTPAIIPDESPCYLCADMPCITACTTGALESISPQQVRMGLAEINLQRCYQANGQPCEYCVERCPLKQQAIEWDDQRRPRILTDGCAGCGVCAYLCPANAISMGAAVTSKLD